MNFIISVPGKLHCILEKVTNFPGQSQVTGLGGKIFTISADVAILADVAIFVMSLFQLMSPFS